MPMELEEPFQLIESMSIQGSDELMDLKKQIKERISITNRNRGEKKMNDEMYWSSLLTVCDAEIKRRKMSSKMPHRSPIQEDIERMLSGKNPSELLRLESDIRKKIKDSNSNDGAAIDVEYWETVLDQLKTFHAKATLREMHGSMLRYRLKVLEKKLETMKSDQENEVDPGEEEVLLLERLRSEVRNSSNYDNSIDNSEAASKLMMAEQSKGLSQNEELLGDALQIPSHVYTWQDKYRPRKPRYFNRVKTGYDWNKYNQTHYDHDNPPPKTVQGYKFTVFYPDRIDKNSVPRYFVEPCGVHFAILRFSGGPPYEDIAFKIVNREWQKKAKHGFRCSFQRGVFTLNFNLKRYRYRA
eukprot:g3145.t1